MRTSKKSKIKKLKKLSYIGKTTKFKRIVSFMVAFGILCSALYFVRFAYKEYAASRATVVLSFPQIAYSEYPDGKRFTYYDLISDENLQAALDIMKAEGKYENFTPDDLRDRFYIYSYFDGSAGQYVSEARSEGYDFSYVANEYRITFIQPHDYKNENILKKFFAPDYSSDFLNALVEVNRERIAETLGGINGFSTLTKMEDTGNYDYSEELNIYRTKINIIRDYLKNLNKNASDFAYGDNELTKSELENKNAFLIANSLDGISDFVESSGLSKDVQLATNKLNVNIENNTLKYNKQTDKSKINQYAIANYDQTFTENLINVVQNKEYGLYQARPKTAFDTVVNQKHDADESIAEYSSKIKQYNDELTIYKTVTQEAKEHERLVKKCNSLIEQFKKDYESLSETTRQVVTAYYNQRNENFIEAKVTNRNLISKDLIVNIGIVFVISAIFAFIVAVAIQTVSDSRKLKRKMKQIKEIKENTEMGA